MTRRKATTAPDPLTEIGDALENPEAAPTMAAPGDRVRDDDGDDGEPFPLDCPVVPLGIQSTIDGSQRCYYLNVNGEIVSLEAGNKHGKNNLVHLFGKSAKYLEKAWTKWSAPKKEYSKADKAWIEVEPARPIGFDQAEASAALIMECSRRGIFDPAGRLRGRGAHAVTGGGLALHVGDGVAAVVPRANGAMGAMAWYDTGLYERFVYPAAAPLARPWPQAVSPDVAVELAALLRTWNWKRPALDPVLLLGAIGQGFIGGALGWRSNVWITGARGTGKSALNGKYGICPAIYGDMLFRTGNSSAAAIRQSLKNSTVPVMLDEIEPSADNRQVTQVIELARIASSGDNMHRGGQDHQAHEFTLQSPFWFSSINIPPIEASDRSRLAILELKPFTADMVAPNFRKYDFATMGRKLFRRMVDGWSYFRPTFDAYHSALLARGHESRGADQFATLLACAWVLLNDQAPDDEDVSHWIEHCRPQRMAEVNDATSDEEACILHLTTFLVQPRGKDSREAISELVGRWVHNSINPSELPGADATRSYVEQIGLKVMNAVWHPAEGDKPGRWGAETFMPRSAPGFLAVAARHQELDKIFSGTKWQGGVWKQTLARVPGAIEGVTISFARAKIRAVMVPLCAIIDESELPELSREAALTEWLAQQKGAEV
ncbi:hypothetical protein [Novosphingobium sp. FSW06-99]|uniref:hypothetical protein n=1 Tax=Novosphingobium sp. FSW06-99 TaxID=1739113 RepID=UPI00076C746B|nr:hypothetical protein [Novosphingobium sp. FSW06-99]KUR80923.1 hypothetical protein AQZ49_02550 [Novosphingobium sp. FSW06-99]